MRAERALLIAERQRQAAIKEQQAVDAAAAAAAHEVELRQRYTALRQELGRAETVPDRHMTVAAMERRVVEMVQEVARVKELRREQLAANAQRSAQQQQAAAAAAERAARKPKAAPPPARTPARLLHYFIEFLSNLHYA